VIIDAITLENFGTYAGLQTIDLSPSPGRPVVLLIGLNGAGKTTFLDAVLLALYGRRAKCSNRGSLGYEDFLRRSIHRYGAHDHAAVTLRLRRHEAGREETLEVRRSWTRDSGDLLDVTINGARDSVATKHWDEVVDRLLPLGIANLFFFDGEKIEQLANVEEAEAIMRTAFNGLLGLEVVDRLESDLRIIERRKAATAGDKNDGEEIRRLGDEIGQLARTRERAIAERASLQNDLDWWQKTEQQVRAEFQRQGGQHYLERETLRERRAAIDKVIVQDENALRALAGGVLPLLLVRPLLEVTTKTLGEERASEQGKRFLDLLTARDARILEELQLQKITAATLARVEQVFTKDRASRRMTKRDRRILNLDDTALQELQGLPETLRVDAGEAEQITRRVLVAERERDELQRRLDSVPDDSRILPILAEVTDAEKKLTAVRKKVAESDEEVARIERELASHEGKRNAVSQRVAEREIDRLDDVRTIRYAARVRKTLTSFREAVLHRHVSRISRLILDSFRVLARKEALIDDVRINTTTLSVQLFDKRGNSIPPERLSAGERQLLATALLWGLGRAAGRPLPVIIDTPLGRLDGTHRRRLLTNYIPNASHQVIVLATDEEISGEEINILEPSIARKHLLQYEDSTMCTTVTRLEEQELRDVS